MEAIDTIRIIAPQPITQTIGDALMKTVSTNTAECSPKYTLMSDIEELHGDDVDFDDEISTAYPAPILECSSSESSQSSSSSSSIASVVSSLSCDDDSLVGDNYEILRGSDILLNEPDPVNNNGVAQHVHASPSIDVQINSMTIHHKNDVIINSEANSTGRDRTHNSIFRQIIGRRNSLQTSPNLVVNANPNTPVRNNIRPPRTLFRDAATGHVKIIPQHNHLNPSPVTGSNSKPPRIYRNPSESSPISVSLSTSMSQSSASYYTAAAASKSVTRPVHRRVVSNTSLLSEGSSHLVFPMVGYSSDLDTSTNYSSSYASRRTSANINNDKGKDDPDVTTMQEADHMLKRKKKNFVKQEMKYFLNRLQSSKFKKPVNAKVKLQRSKHGCLT